MPAQLQVTAKRDFGTSLRDRPLLSTDCTVCNLPKGPDASRCDTGDDTHRPIHGTWRLTRSSAGYGRMPGETNAEAKTYLPSDGLCAVGHRA